MHASIALVYPDVLRTHHGQALRDALLRTQFDYVLFSTNKDNAVIRFPSSGWISGGIKDLAILPSSVQHSCWRVEALADVLESGVNRAAGSFSAAHPVGGTLGHGVAELLGQVDDAEGQTRRMAMTVIADALVFHAALAEAEMLVHDHAAGADRPVAEPRTFRRQGVSALPSSLISGNESLKLTTGLYFTLRARFCELCQPSLLRIFSTCFGKRQSS